MTTEPKRLVVIGAVAAGLKSAAKARRCDPTMKITVVDKGEIISFAGCGLPYYIEGLVKKHEDLFSTALGAVRNPQYFKLMKDVEVLNRHEAFAIDRSKKEVEIRDLRQNKTFKLPYDKLVISTGARPVVPNFPGAHLNGVHTLHTVEDALKIRQIVDEGKTKRAVIVGGGFIGMEASEALRTRGLEVVVLEKLDQVLLMLDPEMASIVHKKLAQKGVELRLGEGLVSLEGDSSGHVEAVVTEKGRIEASLVLMGIGVRPNVELAKQAGLELGVTGAIRVDEFMRTSDPDIYAAGDCAEQIHIVSGKQVLVPLGSTANKQGRVVGINVTGGSARFPGVLGTTILKVFELNVARTGLSEKEARGLGYDIETAIVPAPDGAHYYPGHKTIMTKIVVDRKSRLVLGVQVVGEGDVLSRIDAAASAIHFGATADALADVDLAYAPPYSTPIDPIALAAHVVTNKLDGRTFGISPFEVKKKRERNDDFVFLDVRNQDEFDAQHIPDTTLIPLGQLRNRLSELPKDKEIVTFCKVGLRGYEASNILRNSGFNKVVSMDGGIVTWPFETVEKRK